MEEKVIEERTNSTKHATTISLRSWDSMREFCVTKLETTRGCLPDDDPRYSFHSIVIQVVMDRAKLTSCQPNGVASK